MQDLRMTAERRLMTEEMRAAQHRKARLDMLMGRAKIGETRRKAREDEEKLQAIHHLQAARRRQEAERRAVFTIQRVYRGHLGRKAADRWALKAAEYAAINALMNASAIAIQRIWRYSQIPCRRCCFVVRETTG